MADHTTSGDRQRILAEFGDFVLDHDDLDEILTEGCRLVAQALDADLAKVVEIERHTNAGLVRAGIGWRPGIVGIERIRLDELSSEAFAIETGEPVVANNVAQEERFPLPSFMVDHGVVALVNVPILLPGRKPFGILQVDARQPRKFGPNDIDFLKTYAMVLGPVIDRFQTVAELRNTDERLRLLVENARAYVMIVSDADDRITDWLGGCEDILGWQASEVLGRKSNLIFTEEDRAAGIPERELASAREHGASADIRWHRRKDGTRVFLDGQTIALKDNAGRFVGYFKLGQDCTERKQHEQQQEFLLKLSDDLRPLTSVSDIAAVTTARLCQQLDVNRVVYGDIIGDRLSILEDHARDVPSIVGEYSLETVGSELLAAYRSNTLVKVTDLADDPRFTASARSDLHSRQIAAFIDLVLFAEDERVSLLGVQSALPRTWTAAEENLIREVGERNKSAIERAHADLALRRSEARLRQFGEASSDCLWMRDAETLQWVYLSPAFEAIYGVRVDAALAGDSLITWMNFIVEEDRDHVEASIERVRAGQSLAFEYRIRRPDGEIRWLRDTDFPIYGEHDRVERIGGIGQDITELKHAQQQLEQSEERLRNAIEVGRLGLWDWNIPTGQVHWSDEHFRMEGYAVGEVKPSYETWASRIHPDDRPKAEAALHEAMATHTDFAHEFRAVHPDGSEHWLQGHGRFFYDAQDQPLRMIGSMVETTDRRSWEERQKVLVAELQHRTRNLMAVVRSMADKTVRASTGLADFRARFRDRLEALGRIQGLLSRLSDGDRVTFDNLIRTELTAMGGNPAKVSLKGPEGVRLRSSTVQMLALALHELATNAVKYGALGQPDAHLDITWSLQPNGEEGNPWLHIDWRETGVAMPQHAAPGGTGQGRELIEQALPYQLGAKTTYTLGPDGVHCLISLPVSGTKSENRHE